MHNYMASTQGCLHVDRVYMYVLLPNVVTGVIQALHKSAEPAILAKIVGSRIRCTGYRAELLRWPESPFHRYLSK
jgi:hypothetical protein